MTKQIRTTLLVIVLAILSGCAGLGSIKKTNQLIPGMRLNEVKGILGEPSQTQFVANKWVWKYSLHEYGKGWVPYYLVFDKESQMLESWYADEAEYMRQQQLWLQAMPPTQKHEVDIEVDILDRK